MIEHKPIDINIIGAFTATHAHACMMNSREFVPCENLKYQCCRFWKLQLFDEIIVFDQITN